MNMRFNISGDRPEKGSTIFQFVYVDGDRVMNNTPINDSTNNSNDSNRTVTKQN